MLPRYSEPIPAGSNSSVDSKGRGNESNPVTDKKRVDVSSSSKTFRPKVNCLVVGPSHVTPLTSSMKMGQGIVLHSSTCLEKDGLVVDFNLCPYPSTSEL
ncbi:hypothetical protein GH714_019448 [Hevea brasiliensis]|uniref:Uncharacterized protein n=1 Tax=Hevea brasiliensis TaxID=3981 RepID=A0A6A6L3U4_HEVBR|nr:hypothetical protein GH714_019448 [Hevea brasiliensis]